MTIATREQELETVIRELAVINAKRDEYMKALERLQAKPTPPEGFAFSDAPGLVDQCGVALGWNDSGFCLRRHWGSNCIPAVRWLVPAAPKGLEEENTRLQREVNRLREDQRLIHEQLQKELAVPKREMREDSREDALKKAADLYPENSNIWYALREAYLRVAGFMP